MKKIYDRTTWGKTAIKNNQIRWLCFGIALILICAIGAIFAMTQAPLWIFILVLALMFSTYFYGYFSTEFMMNRWWIKRISKYEEAPNEYSAVVEYMADVIGLEPIGKLEFRKKIVEAEPGELN